MKVKCRICGKSMPSEEAYKVTVGNVNKYYCSELEYNCHAEDKQFHERVRQGIECVLTNILDMPLHKNKTIYKEWQGWKDIAPNTVILEFLRSKESYLTSKIAQIQNSYAKIRYLSAVVKNSIEEDEI